MMKQLIKLLTLTSAISSCCWLLPAHASINISLSDPDWQFLLQNHPLRQTEAKLQPDEKSFARKIQPLLAENQLQQVLDKFSQRDWKKDSPALQLLRAQVLISLKQYDKAKTILNGAVETIPDLALAHRSLSLVALQQGDCKTAQHHLKRSLESGNTDAQLYGQLAYCNLQLNQPVSAIAGYRNALLLEPSSQQWQEGLLYALVQSQAWSQAQGLLGEMLQQQPENAQLWLHRAQVALQQQHHSQALSSLEMAIQLGESKPDNLSHAAQLHMEHGSPRRAVELLQHQMGQFVSSKAKQHRATIGRVAAWLVAKQEWSLLDRLLSEVAKHERQLDADSKSQYAVYRARWYQAEGKTTQARKALKRALSLNPTNGEALLALAGLLGEQNQPEQSALYYLRAEAMDEYRERARIGHAQLAINQHEYKLALQLLRKVRRENPERYDLIANIRTLENIVRQQN